MWLVVVAKVAQATLVSHLLDGPTLIGVTLPSRLLLQGSGQNFTNGQLLPSPTLLSP